MDELERIKLKKMREIIQRANEQEKLKQQRSRLNEEKNNLIKIICEEEASQYLNSLFKTKPETALRIQNILIALANRYSLQAKISRTDIMILERRIEGKGPEIKIKRRGKKEADISTLIGKD